MTPEQREQYEVHHRFGYNGHECLGLRSFEDRDKVELFAGFAAARCVEAGNENMDLHNVVDQWDEKLTEDARK